MTVNWTCVDCKKEVAVEVVRTHSERTICFVVPKGWKVETEKDGISKARCGCAGQEELPTKNLSGVPVLRG